MAVFAGRKVKIKVDLNGIGGAGANWATVGQQRGGSFGQTTETADATHKDDDGWPQDVITRTPWTVSCDGALNPLDSAWGFLNAAWGSKTKVYVQVDASLIGGEKKEGQAVITNISREFPEGDAYTYTLEFKGQGPLVNSP